MLIEARKEYSTPVNKFIVDFFARIGEFADTEPKPNLEERVSFTEYENVKIYDYIDMEEKTVNDYLEEQLEHDREHNRHSKHDRHSLLILVKTGKKYHAIAVTREKLVDHSDGLFYVTCKDPNPNQLTAPVDRTNFQKWYWRCDLGMVVMLPWWRLRNLLDQMTDEKETRIIVATDDRLQQQRNMARVGDVFFINHEGNLNVFGDEVGLSGATKCDHLMLCYETLKLSQ